MQRKSIRQALRELMNNPTAVTQSTKKGQLAYEFRVGSRSRFTIPVRPMQRGNSR